VAAFSEHNRIAGLSLASENVFLQKPAVENQPFNIALCNMMQNGLRCIR
jgi:hypothetical protein